MPDEAAFQAALDAKHTGISTSQAVNEAVDVILRERICWDGDLEDDCTAEWRGLGAHAECMGDTDDDGEPLGYENWYCCVWQINPQARVGSDNKIVFHSSEDDVIPLGGAAARALCERIMRHEALARYARCGN